MSASPAGDAVPTRASGPSALGGRGLRRSWLPAGVIQYLLWGLTLVVVVGPVVPIVVASLWSTPLYEGGGHLTLGNFSRLLSDGAWWSAVGNSLVFAACTTAGALIAGTVMAILVTRTDLPGRRVLGGLFMVPVVLPGLVLILGWIAMWAESGYVTTWIELHTPFSVPGDLFSLAGMIVVGITVGAPVVFLLARGALAALDSSLEDAARTAGARPLRALASVTVPMLRPAMLNSGLIVFAIALEVLGLPLVLGTAPNVTLISTYLYKNWVQVDPPDQGLVAAGAVLLLAAVTLLLLARNRMVGDTARFTTTTGKPRAQVVMRLGRLRWVLAGGIGLMLLVGVVVPLVGIFLSAFTTILTPLIDPLSALTTDNFDKVLGNPLYTKAITNSLLIAGVGGAITTLAVAALSVVAHRSRFRFRGSLQQAMLWPRAMPGLVTGMAFFWSFALLDPEGAVRGTLWGLGLAFAVRSLAFGYSAFYPALAALGEDLDHAARSSGADWWTTMRTIVLRLLRPAMGVSFVLLFVTMLNDADPAVFLVTSETPVMGLTMLQLAVSGIGGPVAAFGVIQLVITVLVLGAGRLLFGARTHV
jgi:iron(III) transport system permease protein